MVVCVTWGKPGKLQRLLSFGKQQLCTVHIILYHDTVALTLRDSVVELRPAHTAHTGAFQSGVKGLPKGAVVGSLFQFHFPLL